MFVPFIRCSRCWRPDFLAGSPQRFTPQVNTSIAAIAVCPEQVVVNPELVDSQGLNHAAAHMAARGIWVQQLTEARSDARYEARPSVPQDMGNKVTSSPTAWYSTNMSLYCNPAGKAGAHGKP